MPHYQPGLQITFAFSPAARQAAEFGAGQMKEKGQAPSDMPQLFHSALPTFGCFRPISARQVTAEQTLGRERKREGKRVPGKQSELTVPDPVTYFPEHHVTAKPTPALRRGEITSYLTPLSRARPAGIWGWVGGRWHAVIASDFIQTTKTISTRQEHEKEEVSSLKS